MRKPGSMWWEMSSGTPLSNDEVRSSLALVVDIWPLPRALLSHTAFGSQPVWSSSGLYPRGRENQPRVVGCSAKLRRRINAEREPYGDTFLAAIHEAFMTPLHCHTCRLCQFNARLSPRGIFVIVPTHSPSSRRITSRPAPRGEQSDSVCASILFCTAAVRMISMNVELAQTAMNPRVSDERRACRSSGAGIDSSQVATPQLPACSVHANFHLTGRLDFDMHADTVCSSDGSCWSTRPLSRATDALSCATLGSMLVRCRVASGDDECEVPSAVFTRLAVPRYLADSMTGFGGSRPAWSVVRRDRAGCGSDDRRVRIGVTPDAIYQCDLPKHPCRLILRRPYLP